MIALRDIHGHDGKKAFKILDGRVIPKHLQRHLDMKRLKAEDVIGDEKKNTPDKSKYTEPLTND